MVTLLAVAIAAAVACVALITFWAWRYQERVVFQPPRLTPEAPFPARRVDYKAADGHAIFGYLVSPGRATETVVIAFHGNADLAAWQVPWARELVEQAGVSVLLAEYRGYGGVPGTPSYEAAGADALGAVSYARSQLRPARLVIFGHSLGSAVASDVAYAMRDDPPSALALQSPFTSAREMAARVLVPPIPWLWNRIGRVHYDTRRIVAELDAPVSVAHGTRDAVVPVRMGRQVHAAARHGRDLLIVDGAGHNDVAEVGGERYWRWLTNAVSARTRPSQEPSIKP